MKIDGFIEIPDIPGESIRTGHEDQLEIYGIEFDMEAPHDINSQARRGRVQLSEVTITKNYDKGSPYIKQACFQNKSLDPVKIYLRRTISGESKDYLVINLTKASVQGYTLRPSPAEPDVLEETVDFAFQEITFTYGDDADEVVMDTHIGI